MIFWRYILQIFDNVNGYWSDKSYILSVNDKLKNEPCKVRETLIDVNPNEPLYYPFVVSLDKCRGSCNTIGGPYARLCVSNKAKNKNVLNFMARVNESRFLVYHNSCRL